MNSLLSSRPTTPVTVGGIYNSAFTTAPIDGQGVPLQMDVMGNLLVNVAVGGGGGGGTVTANQGAAAALAGAWPVEITDGTNVLATAAHPIRIDPTGTTIQPVSGTVTANAGTNLNTSLLALESGGNLAKIASAIAATGAAVPADAVYAGLISTTAFPTAASAGNIVGAMGDKAGRAVVVLNAPRDLAGRQVTTISSSTSETTVVSSSSGNFIDITSLQITNASATIPVTVTLKDATSGTTAAIYDLAAGGGIVAQFPTPLKQSVVTNNWTATLSVATVTVDINIQYVLNK